MADFNPTHSERPWASAALLVIVGIERESLTPDEARLLLHDAADALSRAGGPILHISTPGLEEETDEFRDQVARLVAMADRRPSD